MAKLTKAKTKRLEVVKGISSLEEWLLSLDTTQPDWQMFQKNPHDLWPSKSFTCPTIVVDVSVFIPPLWEDSDGLENDPLSWCLSIVSSKSCKDEFYKEFNSREELLKCLSVLREELGRSSLHPFDYYVGELKKSI